MSNDGVNRRRRLLLITSGLGLVGSAFAATPFVLSMTPSARAKAAGAPVEVDISKLEPGQLLTVEWRGKPVWILKRTPEMLKGLAAVEGKLADPTSAVKDQQPDYAANPTRSIKPDILVVVGICTHLGCSPDKRLEAGAATGLGAGARGQAENEGRARERGPDKPQSARNQQQPSALVNTCFTHETLGIR